MLIDFDRFDIMYWLEGCARGSHLRQGCWERMILLYKELPEDWRRDIYRFAKEQLAEIFSNGRCGAEDFNSFLSCYKPDNRYVVKIDESTEYDAYLHEGRYYISLNWWINPELITSVKKKDKKNGEKKLQDN